MKNIGRLVLASLPLLLASCASAPVGGPSKYAVDRAAQAAKLPGAAADGDELRFGLLCTGYFCSESYAFMARGFIPLMGAAYPDKPSTPKLFAKERPYRNLIWLKSFSEPLDSDVIVKFNLDRSQSQIKAEVVSAYTRRSLYSLECKRCLPGIGAAIYDAFKPGTPMYRALVAEREAVSRPSGGITKADLEDIVKAVSSAQARKPEPEAVAPVVSDVDKPQYSSPENPDDFALVIGIQKYSELPPAEFAERDAQAVVEHLLALGVPRRNIIHLTGEKAGRAGMEKFLERWLPKNINENNRVFFYFAGHGAPDMKSGESYLVPWDGDANFLETTGYPIKRLYERLGELKAKEVVVALDACFSGAGGRSVLAQGARPLVTRLESFTPASEKIVSFSAAGTGEISGSLPEQGHGAFTYYFLKGLSGAAADPSGHVTAKGLYDYLLPKVQDAARRQNRDQTPQLHGPLASLPLR